MAALVSISRTSGFGNRLPSIAPGAVHTADVAVAGARQVDCAEASLASSTRFVELDASAWSNNAAATLSVTVTKRRVP